MSIGQAYADILTPRERQALAEACDWLIDHAFDERERIEKEAKGRVEDRKNAFDEFIDMYFEDTDVAFLFDDRYDGLDETEVAQTLGLSSLAFADWFLPFSDAPSRVAHPYVLEV